MQRRTLLWGMLALALSLGLVACKPRPSYGPPADIPQGVTQDGRPYLGPEDALLEVVLYEDFASSLSRRLHQETEPELLEQYIQTKGFVRLVSVPITAVGLESRLAAEAALCAADFGKYWAYRDALYTVQGQRPFTRENLARLAEEVGISRDRFYACFDLGKHADQVTRFNEEAQAKGVEGAPTFEIAGQVIPGFRPFDDPEMPGLRQVIDILLLEVLTR